MSLLSVMFGAMPWIVILSLGLCLSGGHDTLCSFMIIGISILRALYTSSPYLLYAGKYFLDFFSDSMFLKSDINCSFVLVG